MNQFDAEHYQDAGFLVIKSLLSAEEAQEMTRYYTELRMEDPKPGDYGLNPHDPDDPHNTYPRFLNMHDWDKRSAAWAADKRIADAVATALEDKPILFQTMVYFKPPGGRGQGLHQDQQFLSIDPVIGVWIALDRSDTENGQMRIVPESHNQGLLDVQAADESLSFFPGETTLPPDTEAIGLDMDPGDALLFGGKTIHGSNPNTSESRFRRSFICHFRGERSQNFVPKEGKTMNVFYK